MREQTRSEKQTNVRYLNSKQAHARSEALWRTAFGVLQAASPRLAAEVGAGLFFRTHRSVPRRDEVASLSGAERFEVRLGQHRIAAWSWGTGPLVVLLHGWNGRVGQLGAFVDPLVRAGFSVVGFDAPGHGSSGGTRSSLLDFADAFDAVVDAVRPMFRPVHGVIAHSLGGPATLYALARATGKDATLDGDVAPDWTSTRLVFIAPPIDVREFVDGFGAKMGFGPAAQAAFGARVEATLGVKLGSFHAPTLAHDQRAKLLVLHDEGDREVPLEAGRELAAAWPGACFETTQGLGHTRILSDEAVVERAVRFLRQ